jgi:hypothetical protein
MSARWWKSSSWWKAYVVYLVVIAPFVVLAVLFVHSRWLGWLVTFVIVLGGLIVKDRIQRRIWP